MKNGKKKVTIELVGVDADRACEIFYNMHNAFRGMVDYKENKIVIWKTDESNDLTKSEGIGLSVFLDECEKPKTVKSTLYSVLGRIGSIIWE